MRLTEPRIPPLSESEMDDEGREFVRQASRGRSTPNIYATLAAHPKLLKRWGVFGTHVLHKNTLPDRERELLILRTGWRCRSEYEWGQHVIIGRAAGLNDDEVQRVKDGPEAPGWSPGDAALLRAADELHDDSFISDATWEALAARWDRQQLIDVIFTVGQYHTVLDGAELAGSAARRGVARVRMKRLDGKVAIVTGAGQTPGETIGNGRATAVLFAREGAKVLLADRNIDSARETQEMIEGEGGVAAAFEADVSREPDCAGLVAACRDAYGRIDILHNNVGIGAGDAGPTHLAEDNWDRILDVNLKSVFLTCKHALPVMREQGKGAITNISSIAAVCSVGLIAYKTSKAGVNALTQSLALGNARYGIRVNAIMPGLMNTPMAIEGISAARGMEREQLIKARDAQVPLGGKMGTAWDIAHAALFLASDEARFITGVVLPVDGGQSARIG